jgi:hypothetical protein
VATGGWRLWQVSAEGERCPTGIAVAVGAVVVVGAATLAAVLARTPGPRLGLLTAVVAVFAAVAGDGRAALAVAGVAWPVGNGFLVNRFGELSWHGRVDAWFVIGLLSAVSVGMTISQLRWSRAVRPLVLVLTTVACVVTVVFYADVNAQGGAYAVGVFVLITSVAVAVTLLVAGIAALLLPRITRDTDLRATGIEMDDLAWRFIEDAEASGEIHLIANEPHERDEPEYRTTELQQRQNLHLPNDAPVLFVEVTVIDPADFEAPLRVRGEERYGYRILRVRSSTIANAMAALLLHIRDSTGQLPHIYFSWTEGSPLVYLLRYLFFGDGEIAPVTREVLRKAEPERSRRPLVHVG